MRLAQQLSEAQERVTELEAAQANQAAAVDKATTEMGVEIDDLRQRLADRSEQLTETTEALRQATQRAESAKHYDVDRERTIEQQRGEAELVRVRAVAAEARKWEERETRLVRRIDELTHRPTTIVGGRLGRGGGVGVAGASDGARRQLKTAAAPLPELATTSKDGYVVTDNKGGMGEVLRIPPPPPRRSLG